MDGLPSPDEDDTATYVASLSLLADGEGTQQPPPGPQALNGRADIDSAMVEALKCAMASDPGPPAPGWNAPDRGQFGDAGLTFEVAASRWGPPELAQRCDIDAAMLDALRFAMGADPEVPDA